MLIFRDRTIQSRKNKIHSPEIINYFRNVTIHCALTLFDDVLTGGLRSSRIDFNPLGDRKKERGEGRKSEPLRVIL